MQKRLTRARALAAIGKLAAAATELESLRATTKDEAVRDVSRLLLMAVFVEMPDYQRAGRAARRGVQGAAGEQGRRRRHALLLRARGQTVNSVRTHLERYRAFGVNVADASELPADAAGDCGAPARAARTRGRPGEGSPRRAGKRRHRARARARRGGAARRRRDRADAHRAPRPGSRALAVGSLRGAPAPLRLRDAHRQHQPHPGGAPHAPADRPASKTSAPRRFAE